MNIKLDQNDEYFASGIEYDVWLAGYDGIVRIFNVWSGKKVNQIKTSKYNNICATSLKFNLKETNYLLTVNVDGTIKLNHILMDQPVFELK